MVARTSATAASLGGGAAWNCRRSGARQQPGPAPADALSVGLAAVEALEHPGVDAEHRERLAGQDEAVRASREALAIAELRDTSGLTSNLDVPRAGC